MSLSTGKRLGPYEIVALLGAGGMGEVYRALDTRLDRTVAIKVLPEDLAGDLIRGERFEREARAVSSLSHPNICTLHDVGEQDGIHFLVMEYVEGDSLDHRLEKGPIPLADALRFARQISDALGQAHRQGIVHRDLKPANVMVTPSGVKLLDFGLAKLKDPELSPLSDLTQDGSRALTREGAITGTLEHMSPEQLEGKESSTATDIFALGILIYEMVTGIRPFTGQSAASVIAAIMDQEPRPMSDLRKFVPRALDHVVWRCLRKAPEDRWQTAADVTLELGWVVSLLEEGGDAPRTASVARGWGPWRLALGAVAVLALTAIVAVVFAMFRAATPAELRLEVSTPATLDGSMLAVSPDGEQIVLVANTEGNSRLFLRRLNSTVLEALPGTAGASFPFWSPDSGAIGFFAEEQLKRINLDTGLVQTLAPAPLGRGGTWSGETILYVPHPNGAVFQVSAAGGVPAALDLEDDASSHYWPDFLPDGRHFLYYVSGSGVWIGDTGTSDVTHLLDETHSTATYSPSGHLFFVRQQTLMAQAFDPDTTKLEGNPFPVAEQVTAPAGHAAVSVSRSGAIIYRTGEAQRRLARLSRTGELTGEAMLTSAPQTMSLSPDGRRVATGGSDIWVLELGTNREERVTSDPTGDWMSVWSPDGRRLAFASNRRSGNYEIYTTASSGTVVAEALDVTGLPTDWSRDGRFLLYRTSTSETGDDIWALPIDAERGSAGERFVVVQTEAAERDGQFSPDGNWIAYESNRTGQYEVYVQRFMDSDRVEPVSIGGGAQPRWSPNGTELFYVAPAGDLMSVPVELNGDEIVIGDPVALFRTRIVSVVQQFRQQYAVFPDGQEFLMNVLPEDRDTPPITVILNWKE